jgi:hypothetical protein
MPTEWPRGWWRRTPANNSVKLRPEDPINGLPRADDATPRRVHHNHLLALKARDCCRVPINLASENDERLVGAVVSMVGQWPQSTSIFSLS